MTRIDDPSNPSRRPDRKPRRHAVTLVEVLVVVTILAMAAGIAFLSVGDAAKKHRLRAAADQVVSTWRFARDRARFSGLPTRVVLYEERMTLARPVQRDGAWIWGQPSDVAIHPGVSIAGVSAELERNNTTLHRSELPWTHVIRGSAGGTHAFMLTSRGSLSATLVIDDMMSNSQANLILDEDD